MPTQFTIYRSTDPSAPVLTGQAGSLTTLLDACLVNGYGSKAAAGWTIAFTAVNRRVYKQGSGSLIYFRVRDDAGGLGGALEAQVRGGETWTDVNTCTLNPFPTSAQITLTDNSLVIRKSATANATARVWMVAADSKTAYLFLLTGDNAGYYFATLFGDFYSFVPSDAYTAALIARSGENSGLLNYEDMGFAATYSTPASWSNHSGHYSQRNFVGTSSSVGFMKLTTAFNPGGSWEGGLTFPNPADGAVWLSRVFHGDPVTGGSKSIRGWLRGIWAACHPVINFSDQVTITAAANLAGRTFVVVKLISVVGSVDTCALIETSNTIE